MGSGRLTRAFKSNLTPFFCFHLRAHIGVGSFASQSDGRDAKLPT